MKYFHGWNMEETDDFVESISSNWKCLECSNDETFTTGRVYEKHLRLVHHMDYADANKAMFDYYNDKKSSKFFFSFSLTLFLFHCLSLTHCLTHSSNPSKSSHSNQTLQLKNHNLNPLKTNNSMNKIVFSLKNKNK